MEIEGGLANSRQYHHQATRSGVEQKRISLKCQDPDWLKTASAYMNMLVLHEVGAHGALDLNLVDGGYIVCNSIEKQHRHIRSSGHDRGGRYHQGVLGLEQDRGESFPGVSLPAPSPNKGGIRSESRMKVEEIIQSKSRFRLNVVYQRVQAFKEAYRKRFRMVCDMWGSLQAARTAQ